MSVTEEIKARLDIVSYVQQHVPLKKAGRYYKACCPFHAERTPSFVVYPDRQSWRCYGSCAEGGDVFSFAMKLHGWTFSEALRELGRAVGVETERQSPAERQQYEYRDRLRGVLKIAAAYYHQQLLEPASDPARAALDYTRERRGLSMETIERFGIGYAPDGWQNVLDDLRALGYDDEMIVAAGLAIQKENGHAYDRFRNRLMIPIRDDRGRVVGFGARAMDPNDNAKYINSPQSAVFDKSRLLFGLDMAKAVIRDSGTAVIVEGYMDVIQAHQAGFTNVIAQMGTSLTETQLKLLAPRYARRIVMALDSDAAGQNATRRSLETARGALQADFAGRLSVDVRVLQMPGAKDPDDLIREEPGRWQSLVDDAISIADFVIQMETQGMPHGPAVRDVSIQERESVADRLLPLLLASESDLIQRDNVQKLANRLYIPERSLFDRAQQVRRREQTRAAAQAAQQSAPQAVPGLPPDDYYDEPPPPDYEDMPAPDFDEDGDFDVRLAQPVEAPPRPTRPVSAPPPAVDGTQEAYCLRQLMLNANTYYQINRKLRELAADSLDLRSGPLGDLSVADFKRSDYRALMQMFIFAVKQEELDVLTFLRQNLDPVILEQLESLLVEEEDNVRTRVASRFNADRASIWKLHLRQARPDADLLAEVVAQALLLRRRRLNSEVGEMSFLQESAADAAARRDVDRQIHLLTQAIQRLDMELQQINRLP